MVVVYPRDFTYSKIQIPKFAKEYQKMEVLRCVVMIYFGNFGTKFFLGLHMNLKWIL
jgi:hypothetical protein